MSFGSPRTGPNPRLKCGLRKRLSIGQKSWIKELRKTSKLNENCRARGRTNDTQTPPLTPTSLLTRSGRGSEPANTSEAVMSDEDDWDFAGDDDAKMTIRAAIRYLLKGASGGARGDIVQEIITIVRQVSNGLPPEQPDPL